MTIKLQNNILIHRLTTVSVDLVAGGVTVSADQTGWKLTSHFSIHPVENIITNFKIGVTITQYPGPAITCFPRPFTGSIRIRACLGLG